MKQRGTAYLQLAAALGVVVLFALYTWWIHSEGVTSGKAEVQAEWDRANAEARDRADKARKDREARATEASRKLTDAQSKASDWEAKWRREVAKHKGDKPYVVVECPKVAETESHDAGGRDAGGSGLRLPPAVRLTPEFVRKYDGAWTGTGGEPVFEYPAGSLETALGASPVGVGDLLVVHGENASRCSAQRRQLNKLIDLIESLRTR